MDYTQLYQKNENVDWVSFTCEWMDVPLWDSWVEKTDTAPIKNYNRCITYSSGMRQMYSTKDKKVGTHVIVSGKALGVLRGEGHPDVEIIKKFQEVGAKFSRIDLAVTSSPLPQTSGNEPLEHEFKPSDILNSKDVMKSRLKYDNPVVDPSLNVETVYIGSRKARNRVFRAYDKGLEQGGRAGELIRYELETRKNAGGIALALNSGITPSAIIRRYVDFDNPIWLAIMGEEVATMPQVEYDNEHRTRVLENSKRWEWLIKSVAPTIAKAITQDTELLGLTEYENENMGLLMQAIDDNIAQLLIKKHSIT